MDVDGGAARVLYSVVPGSDEVAKIVRTDVEISAGSTSVLVSIEAGR